MLQSIRDRSQNWIFSVIIGLLVLAFAFWGIESYFGGGQASQTVAVVDGYKITQTDFDAAYQRLRRQLQLSLGAQFNLTPQIEKNLKQQALQQLIGSYVMTQSALDQGYHISQQQLDSVLSSIPAFQDNGQFSVARFQSVLSNLFYREDTFINQLRSDMLVNQIQLGMVNTAFALPNDINNAYELINQTRDIAYLTIPVIRFEKDIKISDEALQQYYDQHKERFRTPEQVSVDYIKLSQLDIEAKQTFSDSELNDYYLNNKDSYTLPERWHVAQILVQVPANADKTTLDQAQTKVAEIEKALQAGKNFSDVAKQYSDDIATRETGGVMPWFNAGMVDIEIEKAVRAMKLGDVSKPVRSKYGFNIIKLLAMEPKQLQLFIKVKAAIKNALAQQKAQKLFATESDQLSNLTFSDANSLQNAAKTLGLPIQTTGLFSREGAKEGVAANAKVVNAAFGNTVLVQNYNSDPITLDDGTLVILHLKQHEPAKIKPFAEVKADILKTLTLDSAKAKAQQLGETLIAAVRQGKNLGQLANENNLKLAEVKNAGRHASDLDTNILNAAFALPRVLSSTASITGIVLPTGNFAVVSLIKVNDGDIKKMTADERKAFQEQIAKGLGQMDYGLYVQQKLKEAKVKTQSKLDSLD